METCVKSSKNLGKQQKTQYVEVLGNKNTIELAFFIFRIVSLSMIAQFLRMRSPRTASMKSHCFDRRFNILFCHGFYFVFLLINESQRDSPYPIPKLQNIWETLLISIVFKFREKWSPDEFEVVVCSSLSGCQKKFSKKTQNVSKKKIYQRQKPLQYTHHSKIRTRT